MLSPLNPAANEFSDAGLQPPSIDYDRLLADIAALRARVAAVSDTLFHSRIAIALETSGDHGAHREPRRSRSTTASCGPSPASFRADDATTVYDHAVAPGHHAVTVDVERRDDRNDAFRTTQRSRFIVDVPADQRLAVDVKLWDDSTWAATSPATRRGSTSSACASRAKAQPDGKVEGSAMKALVCRAYGPLESLAVEERPRSRGRRRVRSSSACARAASTFPTCSSSRASTSSSRRRRSRPAARWPGVVEARGRRASRDCASATASSRSARRGGMAEKLAADASQRGAACPTASTSSPRRVVATAYGTTLHALRDRAQLQAGETLLVLGAAGGVGPRRGADRQAHGRARHRRGVERGEARDVQARTAPTSSSTTPAKT